MATSLALEKPCVVEWSQHGTVTSRASSTTPSGSNEARIWLAALVPPLVLVLVGFAASFIPQRLLRHVRFRDRASRSRCCHGCTGGELHHTLRFPYGEDLLADQTTSSSLARGEWEKDAADTVRSLVHYTIGLAIAAAVIGLFLALPPPAEEARADHGPSELQQTGGAPTATGL